ncbi:Sodium:sulfate symporter transmembrane region-domain-containing protein [Thamnocephalis sphaerospora]|uniref:Sodium:sulfate symporter transmembrane region-domain-containing protein n=1 Tax=Thamnocephalis sphaerospora TaxID=78915 RepID=A0A4V1IVY7_9FUNG|nr:Sodium:sulfate symporter transmembrane region-domain-containing protein [Thamnocephalis sphaerospora]|eukprot:RKP05699.1 Sodium:sulfate symporter transmembrane region-domain-containing protein [Thamnocephalis sphaerospora]
MKFGRQLELNANPDWLDHYIAYSRLKKITYQEERTAAEHLSTHGTDAEVPESLKKSEAFREGLEQELVRIVSFYESTETELFERVDQLLRRCRDERIRREQEADEKEETLAFPIWWEGAWSETLELPRTQHQSQSRTLARLSEHDEEIRVETASITSDREIHFQHSGYASAATSVFELSDDDELIDEARQLFIALSELERYVELNRTGFEKILKKHDKVRETSLRKWFMDGRVGSMRPFQRVSLNALRLRTLRVEIAHGFAANIDNQRKNAALLRRHLRERITISRNTVWRDMINRERMVSTVDVAEQADIEAAMDRPRREITLFGRSFLVPNVPRSILLGVPCLVIFIVLLCVETFSTLPERRCFALLVFASLFWAFEVIPLFATSMLIPLLVVVLGVLRDADGHQLPAPIATKTVFGSMFTPVIMLLLGGFAIAAAFSKYHIARRIAAVVLSKAGTRPPVVLLANLLVAAFLSMWISNVAAPVLCFSLLEPVLRSLPASSNYGKSLVLGIALASNVGGMMSPISSPQNMIALDIMKPAVSWGEWFAVALPVACISLAIVWILLMLVYRPHRENAANIAMRRHDEPFGWRQYFIIVVTVATVILWCVESQIKDYVGDMGVLAIIPLACFFGTGLLTKEDFNNFLWTVIMLAMGGIALGQAVNSSGLLKTIAELISEMEEGFSLWAVLAVFALLMMVVATFVSHTVAALVILPVVNEVGNSLPDQHARLLVMVCVLICSGAMGLPVSGFPNMTAIMLEDSMGRNYLRTLDFIKVGVPATFFATVTAVSVGYGILLALGF